MVKKTVKNLQTKFKWIGKMRKMIVKGKIWNAEEREGVHGVSQKNGERD